MRALRAVGRVAQAAWDWTVVGILIVQIAAMRLFLQLLLWAKGLTIDDIRRFR